MSLNLDDLFPLLTYKYSWSSEHELSLSDFVQKYKPSMVQNDGTKPWIWVRGAENPDKNDEGEEAAIEEAKPLLAEFTKQIEAIKNDASIPVRSNKKTGAKSKKEVRDEKQAEMTAKLEELAKRHNAVSGKWLLMVPSDKVNAIWSSLAQSLVSGPLSKTVAYLAKVSTSPESESANNQHVICLYIPNVFDKKAVTEVMTVLIRNHGFNLSGVKSNLYTTLKIDSKHPSGLQSTIWKTTALMKESEMKELKDAYYKELEDGKAGGSAPAEKESAQSEELAAASAASSALAKPKASKLVKKKKQSDDPFASGSDNDEEDKPPAKGTKQVPKKLTTKTKRPASDSDEEDEKPNKKRK